MTLTIDNNDGLGGVDYTQALLAKAPLTITRRNGEWASCTGGLDLLSTGLPVPQSRARVQVTDAAGNVLFQGFVRANTTSLAEAQTAAGGEDRQQIFAFEQAWLTQAEPVKQLQPAAASSHILAESDAKITVTTVSNGHAEELATDVTVTGENEAYGYVTELFEGDGTTLAFTLGHAPFRATGSETLLTDSFDDALLNIALWTRTDPSSYIMLGAGGLQLNGGNGLDGSTLLQYTSPVEMGGTLVAEATGVALMPGSDGLLLGFYNGSVTHSACMAGIRAVATAGAHVLVAVVNGVEQPVTYDSEAGHTYELRVRIHCSEMQRTGQTYQVLAGNQLQQFGGAVIQAPLHLVIEARDLGLASNTLATVLFDSAISSSPPQCIFAPVNSVQLTGSIAKVSLMQTGSAWVVSTLTDGTVITRRQGAAGTGADYSLSSTGIVRFDTGRAPQPGELVTVTYRRSRRAVAHLKDATADQYRLQLALPGLPVWRGSVSKPKPRTTSDCEAAAQALLAFANASAASQQGELSWTRGAALANDVFPGDTLMLQSADGTQQLPVQAVTITDGNASPELLHYKAEYSQRRATSLSFTVSATVPADVPAEVAYTVDTQGLPTILAGLQVASATAAALQIDSGIDPPSGGGFEVRRSDANFGANVTADLVLQSPVRHFTIPRQAFTERFFVRAYDGSAPPRYSPVSSLVLTSLPLS